MEISWSEFLIAAVDQSIMNFENLYKVFEFLQRDADRNNLTYDLLKSEFLRKAYNNNSD